MTDEKLDEKYRILSDYLDSLYSLIGLQISLSDFVGLCKLNANFYHFFVHRCSYCMQIKADNNLWHKCIRFKYHVYRKSCRTIPSMYVGMCYAGVQEFVFPVRYENKVIGLLHAGPFTLEPEKSKTKITKICRKYGIDEQTLLNDFQSSLNTKIPEAKIVEIFLKAAAAIILDIYVNTKINFRNMQTRSSEDYILTHAIEYIKQNYMNDISIDDISSFCHCSRYYLSRIFNRRINKKINMYINELRVDSAKELLKHSNSSISEISMSVGFNNPNYFCRVFTLISGCTPTEFRKTADNVK